MNRVFSDMKTNVGNNIQDTSSTMASIIGTYLNDIYKDILRRKNWEFIDNDYTFNTTSGTQEYVLPDNFGKEISVRDSTNKRQLSRITLQQLDDDYVSTITDQGTLYRYYIHDRAARKQPSSSSVLACVSSAAGDTTQTLRISGRDSNGVQLSEDVSLNGITPVNTSNSYIEILAISKDAVTTGRVTITSNSAAVTNAIIAPDIKSYRVKKIGFHYVPNSTVAVVLPYVINPQPLSDDNDFPLINCADVLELGATMKAWRYKRQFAKAEDYKKEYEQGIATLMWDAENQPNQVKLFAPRPYSRDTV